METKLKKGKSAIYSSILRIIGLRRRLRLASPTKLKLEILQYCEPSDAILREQYYLDLLKPIIIY
jgi:hypothetical protein